MWISVVVTYSLLIYLLGVIFNAVLHHELLSPDHGKYQKLNTQLIKKEHQALIDNTAWRK